MPAFLLVLLGALVAGGAVYAVSRAREGAAVRPVTPRDPGARIGIPGIGDIGVSPAPLPTSGTGPGGAPTLGDMAAAGSDWIMVGGAPDLLTEGDYQTTYGAASLSLGNMIEDMSRRGWPRDRMSVWRVAGGSVTLPLIGGLADVKSVILIRTDRPGLSGRQLNRAAVVVAADYACKAGFMDARGC